MSYDFLVATKEKPRWEDLLLSPEGVDDSYELSGLSPRKDFALLRHRTVKTFFLLGGPFPARPGDPDLLFLPGETAPPRWISWIQAPCLSGWRVLRRARRWALLLAGKRSGLAVDLATRETLHSTNAETPNIWEEATRKKPRRRKIPILDLEWFLPDTGPSLGKARRFLEILEETHRAFLPSTFGVLDPCATPFDPGRPGPFLDLWGETGRKEKGGMFFWDGRRPCLGGLLSFGDKRVPPDLSLPKESVSMIRIHLALDAGVLRDLSSWREKALDLFVRIARELGAFYAVGAVFRESPLDSGPVLDVDPECLKEESLHPQVNWSGLPRLPAWLHWFGSPYKKHLGGSAPAGDVKTFPEGFLLRFGGTPAPTRELEGMEPPIPKPLAAPARFIPKEIARPNLEEGAPPRVPREEVEVTEFLHLVNPFKVNPLGWLLILLALLAASGVALGLGYALALKIQKLPAGLQVLLVALLAGIPAFLSGVLVLWGGQKALVALGLSVLRKKKARKPTEPTPTQLSRKS